MILRARFSVLIVCATAVWPQTLPTPLRKPIVAWTLIRTPPRALGPQARFSVAVHGAIAPGWHLYALEEPPGGPLETTISLADDDPADLLHVEQGQPDSVMDASFGRRTLLFRYEATFTLRLALKPSVAPGAAPLHVAIRFQSCNGQVCMPPHTDTLTLPIAVR